jgi:hypothetical protein
MKRCFSATIFVLSLLSMASVGQASMALTAAARSGNVEKVKALLNEGEPTDVQARRSVYCSP